MKDLIEALQILLKYGDPKYPTVCRYDVLYICGIRPEDVSTQDIDRLQELGFEAGYDERFSPSEMVFYSFKYGDC